MVLTHLLSLYNQMMSESRAPSEQWGLCQAGECARQDGPLLVANVGPSLSTQINRKHSVLCMWIGGRYVYVDNWV